MIKGERIYLRLFETMDYMETIKYRNDEEITKLLGGNTYCVSTEIEKRWVEQKSISNIDELYFAICLKSDNSMIGYCSIINIDLRNLKAELGGTIIGDSSNRGKGYGKEAQILMLRHCFEELPLHKVYGYSLAEHKVTEEMMISLGFHIDGTLRDEVYKNGNFKSYTIYSILRNEYEAIYLSDNE